MKDILFLILLLIALLAASVAIDSLWGQNQGAVPRKDRINVYDVDVFELPLSKKHALAYRMRDKNGKRVATHIIRIDLASGMTWIDEPGSGTRSEFFIPGRNLSHNMKFSQYMAAMERAKKEIDEGTLPTLLELYREWEEEDVENVK